EHSAASCSLPRKSSACGSRWRAGTKRRCCACRTITKNLIDNGAEYAIGVVSASVRNRPDPGCRRCGTMVTFTLRGVANSLTVAKSMRNLLFLTIAGTRVLCAQSGELPVEWIDRDTGHRVIRLSREAGTQSLYFNQNAY